MTTVAHDTPLPEEPGRLSRLSDRLNPILVREVQQSLRGKAFVVVLSIALASIVVTTLVVAAEGRTGGGVGREYFTVALVLLTPIALFLIPIQAFLSMQQELRGGIGEQLLLSRLTPGRIVRGKLMAAMVQILLFVSVFGPLLALTFLMRGIDVPTIAFFLVSGVFFCLLASAFAIAMGALGRHRVLTAFFFAATALGLGAASIGLMSTMWLSVRELASEMRTRDFWLATGVFATVCAGALVLLGMVARSLLTHPNENRSSSFRLFTVGMMAAAVAWVFGAVPPGDYSEAGRGLALMAIVALMPFWLFALTEEEELSPRMRTLVPRSRPLAWLAAPFLPGGGRAVAFVVVTSALAVGIGGAFEFLHELLAPVARRSTHPRWELVAMCWCYGVFYGGLGRLVRARLPRTPAMTWLARLVPPLLVVLGCVLPAFVEIMVSGRLRSWSPLHLSNPFWSLDDARAADDFLWLLGLAAGAVLLVNWPAMQRGVREVLEASRQRGAGARDAS